MSILNHAEILLRRVVRRPKSISPLVLRGGAVLEGDASSAAGATIRGGEVQIKSGFDVRVSGGVATLMLSGGGTAGRFRCKCSGDSGSCLVEVKSGPESVLKCLSHDCTGSCSIDIKMDPAFRLQVLQ